MRSSHHHRGARAHTLRLSVLAVLIGQIFPAWAAADLPSQNPLVNRATLPPLPNVVLTVDDSGSMTYQYLPEKSFTLNNQPVAFPDDKRVYLHPKELDRNLYLNGDITRFLSAAAETELNKTMLLTQMQMRSPHLNRIYYNPYIRYIPWKTADNRPYADATPSAAVLHPSLLHPDNTQSATSSEKVDLTTSTSHSVRWYCRTDNDWDKCTKPTDDSPGEKNMAITQLSYAPALLYMLKAGHNPNEAASYDAYNLNATDSFSWPKDDVAAGTNLAARAEQPGCAITGDNLVCSQAAELQNFANWFVFYRSRLFIAQGTMPEALRDSKGLIRLGWGTIHPAFSRDAEGREVWSTFNSDSDHGGASTQRSYTVQQGVRNLDQTHLNSFTTWLRNLKTYRFTPNLHAVYSVGQYFKRTDALNPWQNDMTTATDSSSPLSCRRSYHLLVTDGYYQDNATLDSWGNMFASAGLSLPSVGNADRDHLGMNQVVPVKPGRAATEDPSPFPGSRNASGALYTSNAFADNLGNTLADYAMDLWVTDLQPGIADEVKPIDKKTDPASIASVELIKEVESDPATWQHLTHFTVGFGLTGTLNAKDGIGPLINGSKAWPSTLSQVDDLWHAAINSRGRYFAANNSVELQQSLKDALAGTDIEPQREAGLATAMPYLVGNNIKYVPEYNAKDWSGDLKAYSLNAAGVAAATETWKASDFVPEPGARTIVIWQDFGNGDRRAIPFNSRAALDIETQIHIDSDALINYIRGENINGMRKRTSKLPDFVNSTPLLVKAGFDLGYFSTTMTGHDAYDDYLRSKRARTNGVIFVGGNGGMLHAFDAGEGHEQFAFVPRAAAPKLPLIARPGYGEPGTSHQYVVDGPLMESDVYITENGNRVWRNIVVGTMGAGGRSVFALTVPTDNPLQLTEENVKLEVTHPDMGYITSQPQVGLAPDGKWKIFVGNGVNSASGRTALLVIDIESKAVSSIVLAESTNNQTHHGMGGVELARDARSGKVMAVFGGDTNGRLWRVDLAGSGSADSATSVDEDAASAGDASTVTYTHTQIFAAKDAVGNAQPILATPLLYPHPNGGRMVVFNTGQLIYNDDLAVQRVQSAYGVWDKVASAETSPEVLERSNLKAQSVLETVEVVQVNTAKKNSFFVTSQNTIDWTSQYGWVLDLVVKETSAIGAPEARPKAIYDPIPLGNSVLISSVKPGPEGPTCGESEALNFGFVLKALTGASPSYASIDVNNDGAITSGESKASGFTYRGSDQQALRRRNDGGGGDGGDDTGNPPNGPGSGSGSSNCSEFSLQNAYGSRLAQDCERMLIKDRVWRQLLNPPAPQ